ncbi:hypothetical protein [Streptomyces sp. NPDC058773]|uniref:hypothetical protein n=1 Tax=Streptomyces sp. NPDC058773 TaxID=3346632 RepID=UPI0036914029
MNTGRWAMICTVTAALTGGPAVVPASAGSVTAQSASPATAEHGQAAGQADLQRASWRYVWGPSGITRTYFAEHNSKWNSRPYTTNVKNHGVWYTCMKNRYARITIKNVDRNKTILDTGWKKCTGTRQAKQATGAYNPGETLRVYAYAGNPITWVKVGAVEKR